VSRAGISDPRPGGDGTLLGEPVLVFRPGYGIFDQDGNKLGTAHRIHDKYPHYELRDTEVRCVVRNTMRNRNRHGSVWEYVVCTPDGEEGREAQPTPRMVSRRTLHGGARDGDDRDAGQAIRRAAEYPARPPHSITC
jgi:hypothetical protein